jgi:hypothetical protein
MDMDKRFAKYQWIDVSVVRAKQDPRPESYTPDIDSIQIGESVSRARNWEARRELVRPLVSHCLCCIKETAARDGSPTLGLFKPFEIERLTITPAAANWSPDELAKLRRYTMFEKAPAKELEKIPFRFEYRFKCDHQSCRGHGLSCTDWEMLEAYRDWRNRYGPEWEAKFRLRFEDEMIKKYDTHFYVGNQLRFPNAWLIVGLFYPGRELTRRLI